MKCIYLIVSFIYFELSSVIKHLITRKLYSFYFIFLNQVQQSILSPMTSGVPNSSPLASTHCTVCMSLLSHTPDSDHQLVKRELHELGCVPIDIDYAKILCVSQLKFTSLNRMRSFATPCNVKHRRNSSRAYQSLRFDAKMFFFK